MGLGQCVIDIGAECVQRGTSLFEHFTAGHFGSTQTTTYQYLDSFSPHPYGGSHRHFYGTAVGNAAFYLSCNVVGNNGGIQFRALHFKNVDLDFFIGNFL